MTIFDLLDSAQIVAYWTELSQHEAPYPCEELFPTNKKRGLDLKWLKGAKGLPIVLKTSAFDAAAIPRGRIGFEKLSAEMPYFKESMYIDEELRQELNIVLETGNRAYIDSVMTRVFDDEVQLLRSARVSRERMRMMALTTGVISMANNGQAFTYDYGVPNTHKVTVQTSWSNHADSDPIKDINDGMELIFDETGVKPKRAMCDNTTWRHLRANEGIANDIYARRDRVGHITDSMLKEYIADMCDGLVIYVNAKKYKDETGTATQFMPADTFVLFPEGMLGNTWFGTTPAESDLMSGAAANVSITDTGVAVVTAKKIDPVQVETIVSMICLPSFEEADKIYILDTTA